MRARRQGRWWLVAAALCGSTTYTECGPLEAAGLYATLSSTLQRWQSSYGWSVPPVAAGTGAA